MTKIDATDHRSTKLTEMSQEGKHKLKWSTWPTVSFPGPLRAITYLCTARDTLTALRTEIIGLFSAFHVLLWVLKLKENHNTPNYFNSLSQIFGFEVTVGIFFQNGRRLSLFYLGAVATFWPMSLAGPQQLLRDPAYIALCKSRKEHQEWAKDQQRSKRCTSQGISRGNPETESYVFGPDGSSSRLCDRCDISNGLTLYFWIPEW